MTVTAPTERGTILAASLTAVMWGLTGIFVRLLPGLSPLAVTTVRLSGSLIVAFPLFAISDAKRSSLKLAVKKPVAYALASLLAGYYLLATAAFQLAPVAEVALLLSTPPLFVLALRRIRGDVPKVLEVLGEAIAQVFRRAIVCQLVRPGVARVQDLRRNSMASMPSARAPPPRTCWSSCCRSPASKTSPS